MCYQINYMLPCEHVRTHIVYCADAPPASTASEWPSSAAGPRAERRSKGLKSSKSRGGGGGDGCGSSSSSSSDNINSNKNNSNNNSHRHTNGTGADWASSSSSPAAATTTTTTTARRPCRNLTQQSLPYPMPPSFAGSPTAAASSPLLPKCPLERCPFEEKNRCWNCCWCGKQCNDTGRCRCVMIIEGNRVECEHICCGNCTAA